MFLFATPVGKVRMGLDRAGKTYSVLSDHKPICRQQLLVHGSWPFFWDQGKGSWEGRGHTRCPQGAWGPMRLSVLAVVLTHVQAVLDILTGLKMLGRKFSWKHLSDVSTTLWWVCNIVVWDLSSPFLIPMQHLSAGRCPVSYDLSCPGCLGVWHWICRKVVCTGQKMAPWNCEAPRLMGKTYKMCLAMFRRHLFDTFPSG